MSKNLTTIVKHPLSKENVPGYVRDFGEPDGHYITNCHGDRQSIFTGPVLDRLFEFESLGLEPEDIRSLMAAHSDLLEKQKKKKVSVVKSFRHSVDERPYKENNCATFSSVEECRYYKCPSCNCNLAIRFKVTELYPDRTIHTRGDHMRTIVYTGRNICSECKQALDWSDVDKETWA